MTSFLNPLLEARLKSLIYRLRFIGLYVLFGFLSIILEFFIRTFLISISFNQILSTLLAISCGILFAFWTNVMFNFKIPKSRRDSALIYFVVISCFSGIVQLSLKKFVALDYLSYEWGRLLISGSIFILAYAFHRKYSFRDFKKVGIAIYANGVENLEHIHSKIGNYPDFIHVDIVDKSMSDDAEDVKTYRLETMKAYWPTIQIQTHLMSYEPAQWLDRVLPYSDVIYIHVECKDNIKLLIKKIKQSGKKAGIALTMATNPDDILDILEIANYVLLLTIPKPGSSGQKFDIDSIERIKHINNLSFRNQFVLCIDGGINENIIGMLEAENIVSGSSVLTNVDPKKQIMRLQTVGRYEAA
ncbi:GtrA family protein [Candidatus Marinimicrobia bacterium]|nr:GtrA family protein [Candidatus Neomarinimicrobiota bacterium]